MSLSFPAWNYVKIGGRSYKILLQARGNLPKWQSSNGENTPSKCKACREVYNAPPSINFINSVDITGNPQHGFTKDVNLLMLT